MISEDVSVDQQELTFSNGKKLEQPLWKKNLA